MQDNPNEDVRRKHTTDESPPPKQRLIRLVGFYSEVVRTLLRPDNFGFTSKNFEGLTSLLPLHIMGRKKLKMEKKSCALLYYK